MQYVPVTVRQQVQRDTKIWSSAIYQINAEYEKQIKHLSCNNIFTYLLGKRMLFETYIFSPFPFWYIFHKES